MSADRVIARGCRLASLTVLVTTLSLLGLLTVAPAIAAPLQVAVEDVRSEAGVLRLEVVAVTGAGEEGEAVASLLLPPATPRTRATLHDLQPGRYLIRVHHDLDGDGRMATNLIGLPQEPWGVSNDARGRFGPPAVDDMVVEVPEAGTAVRITLVH